MELTGKRVLVYGAGKSGIGAAGLLSDMGAVPILYDEREDLDIDKIRSNFPGSAEGMEICTGTLEETMLRSLDMAVLSPGVSLEKPLVQELYRRDLKVIGEVELAFMATSGMILAVTGTNGKTTTTALLGKIMSDSCESVFVVGNIGTAWTSEAQKTRPDSVTVAEISSFQLETIDHFAPKVSAILNITEDHLNRHHTMEEYARVKELITRNQTSDDFCVLNADDPVLRNFASSCVPKIIWFSSTRMLEEGMFVRDGQIIFRQAGKEIPVVEISKLKILGRHNVENAMAAAAMAYAAGIPMEKIRQSMEEFTAVPHRIEFVAEKKGVLYYNDSKGTNPDAAIKGIQAMTRPTWLIGGGYDKGSAYDEWIQSFEGRVKRLVLIGETKNKIMKSAVRNGFTDVTLCENLTEALTLCASESEEGDAVLLSPACASWDQFDNYEQRGDRFKELVHSLED